MSKISDLHAEGVTDLFSYSKGFEDGTDEERQRIFNALKAIGSGGDYYETRWTEIMKIFTVSLSK